MRDDQRGDGHKRGNQAFESGVQQAIQLVKFSLRIKLGQKREGSNADALADHAQGHAHERLGVTQPGDRGRLEVGAEPADDPVVGEGQRQREHDRHRQANEQTKARMEQVEIGIETGADGDRAVHLQQKIAGERSDNDADGKTGHADARSQEPAAQDDHDVVNHRGERRHDEASFGILNRAENAAFVETELRGKHQARQENDARFFLGRKSRSDQPCQLRRKDFAGEHEGDEQQPHEGHYRGEDMPALILAAFRGVFGEHWNERDAKGCAGDQIIEEVGKRESGVIGIGHGIGTNLVRYHPFAHESQDAAEQNAGHDDGSGGYDTAMEARLAHRAMVEVLRMFA